MPSTYQERIQQKRQEAQTTTESAAQKRMQADVLDQLKSIEQTTKDGNTQRPGAMTARQQKLFDTVREILETDEQRITAENHSELLDALKELQQTQEASSTTAESLNREVLSALDEVAGAVRNLDMSPVINTPAPIVNVPETQVQVSPSKVDLKPLQDTIKEYFRLPETQDSGIDLDCYRAQDIIDNPDKQYIGFLNPDGDWYIIENDILSNSMRYAFGSGNYGKAFKKAASYQYLLLNEAINAAA